ncbi:MAG TPA: SPOR domain-containing protein [Dyella sp.]|uniref:SPOR domain-containing protein n=1 Tax=Dyella sp. TaxID=1869338 RepID=UPI002C501B9F|nr:SPOR domain-containing protein [Dyella sp.]HTV86444.1 SPOR domain-containing protein [Dyella sp.]
MLLRLLFVLLIALNIAVGAWLLLGQDEVHRQFVTDPGVPKLRLLSELPPSSATVARAASVTPPAAPSSSPVPASPLSASAASTPASTNALSYACMALGPFATQEDLRIARNALSAQVQRARARQEQTTQSRGWWVHLPPSPSHGAALAQARALAAHNIQDYFVVGSGDDQNTVSLGLFKDPANARKRRDQIQAAGFPVQMSERTETVPEYWLDLIPIDSGHFDWRSKIRDPAIGSHSTGCF